VTDSSTSTTANPSVFFAGSVPLNGSFTASAGQSTFPTNTYFYIYSAQGGTLLQSIGVHTSCSQPLFTGNQFGSVRLTGFTVQ
jgi:hypothetical protein